MSQYCIAYIHADSDREICSLDLFSVGGELNISQGSTSFQGTGV
jgi:hypothetical protein